MLWFPVLFSLFNEVTLRIKKRYVLTRFEAISSLKVNLGNLKTVPIGNVQNMEEEMVQILGCKFSNMSMKYLSLPLGSNSKSKKILNSILKRMARCLAGWKRLYL